MVSLNEIFTMLATGEFSNISLQRDDSGQIDESEYESVINHLNLGLTEIYKRFNFLNYEILLHVDPSVETYYLHPERVVPLAQISTTNYLQRPDDWDGYINIVEVKDVFDSDGEPYTLNNRLKTPAILQLAPDRLKITGVETAEIMSVLYQAFPAKIVLDDDLDITDTYISLPETAIEALLYYIAMRVYKPIGKNDSTAQADKSQSYQAQFELSCTRIEQFGLDIDEDENDIDDRFTEKGWA